MFQVKPLYCAGLPAVLVVAFTLCCALTAADAGPKMRSLWTPP
jgi:hypothetical protein